MNRYLPILFCCYFTWVWFQRVNSYRQIPLGHCNTNRSWCLPSGFALPQFVLSLPQLRVSIYTDHRNISKIRQLTLSHSSDVTLMIGRVISIHLAFQGAHEHICTCKYKYMQISTQTEHFEYNYSYV